MWKNLWSQKEKDEYVSLDRIRTATRSERIITWKTQAEEQKWFEPFCAAPAFLLLSLSQMLTSLYRGLQIVCHCIFLFLLCFFSHFLNPFPMLLFLVYCSTYEFFAPWIFDFYLLWHYSPEKFWYLRQNTFINFFKSCLNSFQIFTQPTGIQAGKGHSLETRSIVGSPLVKTSSSGNSTRTYIHTYIWSDAVDCIRWLKRLKSCPSHQTTISVPIKTSQ